MTLIAKKGALVGKLGDEERDIDAALDDVERCRGLSEAGGLLLPRADAFGLACARLRTLRQKHARTALAFVEVQLRLDALDREEASR